MAGEHTYAEIMSQPEAWRAGLQSLAERHDDIASIDPHDFDQVIFTGCGSTYYLALAAASLCQQLTGVYARGLPASEVWLHSATAYSAAGNTLLVAVSRSGTTTETVRSVERFKANARGKVITISCYPDSDLPQMGDLNLVLTSGQEKSVAQTRAFSVLYLAATYLAHTWAGIPTQAMDQLPAVGERLLETYNYLAGRLGRNQDLDRFYFLGSGPRYGLACELSLKMKEMTLSHSEPFHVLEFRHGPQSMITETTLMVGLVSEVNGSKERAVFSEAQGRGARILTLAEADAEVNLASNVPESLRNVLYLPVLQHLAFERSLAKGLDPDRPHNLESVVRIT